MFKSKLMAAAALSFFALAAHAAKVEPLTPYAGTLPPALQFAKTSGNLEIYKKFPAVGGLDGWVVEDKSSGKNVILYSTADGEGLVAGMLMDKSGKNLSAEYSETHIPEKDYSVALTEFKEAPHVSDGVDTAPAEMVIAFDPNCGYCKLMHKLVDPAVKAGELKVRYVPVAILGGDSGIKAAGLLASKNGPEALNKAVLGQAETSSDRALMAQVDANTQLMRKHGFNGTPAILYSVKNANGDQTVYVSNGVPRLLEMFSRMGISGQIDKLKEAIKVDPSLARYVQ